MLIKFQIFFTDFSASGQAHFKKFGNVRTGTCCDNALALRPRSLNIKLHRSSDLNPEYHIIDVDLPQSEEQLSFVIHFLLLFSF